MSNTVEEILNHVGVGWCGNPFCNKEPYTVDEAIEAINQLLIEAKIEELSILGRNQWLEPPDFERYKVKDSVIKSRISELQSTLKKES